MADDQLENLHISVMQNFLPVGLAMVERARRGGAAKLVEVFTASNDPLQKLRVEGEPAARSVREQLDHVSPGLGNPVMPVTVEVDDAAPNFDEFQDQKDLLELLARVEVRLEELEAYFSEEDGGVTFVSTAQG